MVRELPKPEELVERPALFKDTAGSIRTLRRTFKDRLRDIDPDRFHAEMESESDRSVIIFLAAHLDDALAVRVARYLCFSPDSDDLDYVFRFEGPLGTFSGRMEVALLFGMIDDATYEQLDIIRELRNACAHSRHVLGFEDSEVANVTMRLFAPLGVTDPPTNDEKSQIRRFFVSECRVLLLTLVLGSRAAAIEFSRKVRDAEQ